jgi:hypothetical protein
MRRSLCRLLLALTALALTSLTAAPADDPPPPKNPEDLVKKVSAAARKEDFKTVRHYLTGDARDWLAFIERSLDLHARLEKALEAKFGKAPKGPTARPPFTREQLSAFFDLRLKGSRVEGDRAVLTVALAGDAKRTLKTYAIPGKGGWKLFMLAIGFGPPEPGEEIDLSTDRIRDALAGEWENVRGWNDRLKRFTERVEAGEFITREEAEKGYRKDVQRATAVTKDKKATKDE